MPSSLSLAELSAAIRGGAAALRSLTTLQPIPLRKCKGAEKIRLKVSYTATPNKLLMKCA